MITRHESTGGHRTKYAVQTPQLSLHEDHNSVHVVYITLCRCRNECNDFMFAFVETMIHIDEMTRWLLQ